MDAYISGDAMWLFQFTHPGGVRPSVAVLTEQTPKVSIHAPGRGATAEQLEGLDGVEFQFTHPGGVRPYHKASGR